MKASVLTYGCAVNQADSEVISALLKNAGWELVDEDNAELIVVNSCIVKGPTEKKILRKLQDLGKTGKRVIVTGCMPQAYPELLRGFGFECIGTDPLELAELLALERPQGSRIMADSIRANPFVEVIPISEGCLGDCSYCAVKMARGRLKSFPFDEIIKRVETAVAEGVKEIRLTSQDNGCYGFDVGTNLAELLREICSVSGDFKIRVGMMNPVHIKGFLPELIDAFKDEKVYKFVHIPVQSGSDSVLKRMNRGYTTKEFKEIVAAFRAAMSITVATDIIVAFPEETEAEFKETLEMINYVKPEVLNASRYWLRKRTEAEKMEQIDMKVSKDRVKVLIDGFLKVSRAEKDSWIGWQGDVLITGEKNGFYIGRNRNYRPIQVEESELGGIERVKIIKMLGGNFIGRSV
jgi:threonylcarbamoyladenosine tRNA methylthiotransferase CDKAL1